MARFLFEAEITAEPEDIEVLVGAVGPEMADELPGVTVALDRPGPGQARLTVTGDRVPQVRAAVNAYIGWARTVEDVLAVSPAPHRRTKDGR